MPVIKTIEYGESIQVSFDTWSRLTVTAELIPNETEDQAYEQLRAFVSEKLRKQTELTVVQQLASKPKGKEATIDHLISQINDTTTLDKASGGLLSFEALVYTTNNEKLTQAYQNQLKKLQ